MLDPKQTLRVAPGEVITRLGSQATSLFLVLQGTIGVYTDLAGDTPLMLEDGAATFKRGTLIGDTEAFSGSPYLTTTKALTAATLQIVSTERLSTEINRCSPFVRGLIRIQAGRVRTLVRLLSNNAEIAGRMAEFSPEAIIGEPLPKDLLDEAETNP